MQMPNGLPFPLSDVRLGRPCYRCQSSAGNDYHSLLTSTHTEREGLAMAMTSSSFLVFSFAPGTSFTLLPFLPLKRRPRALTSSLEPRGGGGRLRFLSFFLLPSTLPVDAEGEREEKREQQAQSMAMGVNGESDRKVIDCCGRRQTCSSVLFH